MQQNKNIGCVSKFGFISCKYLMLIWYDNLVFQITVVPLRLDLQGLIFTRVDFALTPSFTWLHYYCCYLKGSQR